MKTLFEIKYVEFKPSDPEMKNILKEYEKQGWIIEKISAKWGKNKRYKFKKTLNKAV